MYKHRTQCVLLVMLFQGQGCAEETNLIEAKPTLVPTPTMLATTALVRLSATQYRNAMSDLFGPDVLIPSQLEPDIAINGLIAVGAAQTTISARGLEQYQTAAYEVASQAIGSPAIRQRFMSCEPVGTADLDCARHALRGLGLRAWRRPLTDIELESLATLASEAATTLGDFYAGLEFGVAALLQSPYFLYRAEFGQPDPHAPSRHRFTDYEMATRLSLFLWNTIPDDGLLQAAARQELTTDTGLSAQVNRLLDSPRSRHAVRNFFTDLFALHALDHLDKDPTQFTHISPEVGPDAREETLRLIEDMVFERDGDYRELFTSDRSFINRRLASIYGVRAPVREGFGKIHWEPTQQRRGLLTHISLLALHSHPVSSSATLRGQFVRKTLLCGIISAPPVDVDTALPEPSGTTRTLRERVDEHLTDPGCRSCHLSMDPIGLGLENYDALGQFRTRDNGALIDASGDVDGDPFSNALDLGRAIHDSPKLAPCLVRNIYRYATGHIEQQSETAMLEAIDENFVTSGYRVRALMRDIALSPGFRFVAPPTNEALP